MGQAMKAVSAEELKHRCGTLVGDEVCRAACAALESAREARELLRSGEYCATELAESFIEGLRTGPLVIVN